MNQFNRTRSVKIATLASHAANVRTAVDAEMQLSLSALFVNGVTIVAIVTIAAIAETQPTISVQTAVIARTAVNVITANRAILAWTPTDFAESAIGAMTAAVAIAVHLPHIKADSNFILPSLESIS